MTRFPYLRILAPFVVLLAASAQSWNAKPVSQWSEEDARQLLTASPWVKTTKVAVIPARGEDQMREGGRMGGAGVAAATMNRELVIRWESALPVRTAELLAHDASAPDWDGDYYVIAVYDVAGLTAADRRSLARDLKNAALLKREGKKDLKPERVDVVPSANKLTRIVYLFPRSTPISRDDRRLEFVAQIGRLSLTQHFLTEEMVLEGKLAL